MKALLISSLLISSTSFAQALDVPALKKLMTQKKAVIEKINPGMSKKLSTTTRIPTELGPCELTEELVQTVLKIEGEKIIVHSKEKYTPAATPACAGFESSEVGVVFFDDVPSLDKELEDLDASAKDITSISRAGDVVTMKIATSTLVYDFNKPAFKNLISIKDTAFSTTSTDISDIDVNSINLQKVLFCESVDSQNCIEGDFSDILF